MARCVACRPLSLAYFMKPLLYFCLLRSCDPRTLTSALTSALTFAITSALQTAATSWQFDVFAFAEATPGTTLSVLFFFLTKHSGVLQELYFDESKLCTFLKRMDQGYDPSNAYHNRCIQRPGSILAVCKATTAVNKHCPVESTTFHATSLSM